MKTLTVKVKGENALECYNTLTNHLRYGLMAEDILMHGNAKGEYKNCSFEIVDDAEVKNDTI